MSNKEKEDNPNAQNWLDLASHFQAKVQKRTSEVAFLQTKAGFLIAAAVILLQTISSLPRLEGDLGMAAQIAAAVLGLASLIYAIISMHIEKSTTPLNPDEMILELTERPQTREQFGNWLAKSYALANKEFNKEYNKKYEQQVISAKLLVVSFVIVLIIKWVNTYV